MVDLDGSYLKTDTLHELIAVALRRPSVLLQAVVALGRGGKAQFKAVLAEHLHLDIATLPRNAEVEALVSRARDNGQTVILATGADRAIAGEFTGPEEPFSEYLASDGEVNLTGERKAAALVERFGERGFDYVGNSSADLAVWEHSAAKYLAVPNARASKRYAGVSFDAILSAHGRRSAAAWMKAIRPHQSAKNVLLVLPLIASHQLGNAQAWALLIAGMLVFTLMASSVYLLNDTLDLNSDRLHAKKSRRPIAAGDILPGHALGASALLLAVALLGGGLLGFEFFLVLLCYAVVTVAYSFWLKRVVLVDVITLAMLYMVRIVAGAVLVGVALSFWLASVSVFLFLSLAFAKRFAEISSARGEGHKALPGRGYRHGDAAVLAALGIGAGTASLVFLASYIQSQNVQLLYSGPSLLWLVVPIYFYWIANLWIEASRGGMHEDPVLFALKNPASRISAALIAAIFIAATFVHIGTGFVLNG